MVSTKYEELSRFCLYINAEDAMVSKCVKFENGLRSEIYQYICFHEIIDFDTLVHKCRMFDDAGKAKVTGKGFALNAEELEQPDNLT